jgi:hypothetical protein
VALVTEAGSQANLAETQGRFVKQLFGAFNPFSQNVLMGARPGACFEKLGKVIYAHSSRLG